MDFSDESLVRKTLEGDSSAFDVLVDKHRGVVHGLCYHLAHNSAEAEDLAQEAFVKAYLNLYSLSEPSKFLSWLRKIAQNVCHDWLRRQKENTVSLEVIPKDEPAMSPSPAELCEAKERQEKIMDAIASLSKKNQQTVTLYYLDGCSSKEVADFLGISVTAVESRLYEARKQLKKELMEMVKENLESQKLSDDFTERVQEAIKQARKAQSQHVYREVITYCDEALDALANLNDSVENKRMKKEVLGLKGNAVKRSLTRREATKYYEEALELEMETGDKPNQARAIKEMGRHYSNIGNDEKAVEYYQRALGMFTELGDKAGQAEILQWFGAQNLWERNVEEGISYYQRGLDIFVELGDKKSEASSLAGINFLKRFGEQRLEEDRSKIIFKGAVCETFDKSPGVLVYLGLSGILSSVRGENPEDTFFDSGPFRWLPDMMKLLDSSLSVGDSWSMNVPSGGEPMKITVTIQSDSESVTVPAGEFTNCLKTKIVTSEEPKDCSFKHSGDREFIYAPGVGLVKSTFVRRDGAVGIAKLVSYSISNGGEDYFPLALGNEWSYEWANAEGSFPSSTDIYEVTGLNKDVRTVADVTGDRYYLSHYFYAFGQSGGMEAAIGELIKLDSDKERDVTAGYLGAYRRKKGDECSWYSIFQSEFDSLISCPEIKVSRIVTPFINPITISIMKELVDGDKTGEELIQACGVAKEELRVMDNLIELDLVKKKDTKYAITRYGIATTFTLLALAKVKF